MKKILILLGMLMVFGLIGVSEVSAWYGWGFWPSYGVNSYQNHYGGNYGYSVGSCPGYHGHYSRCGSYNRWSGWNSGEYYSARRNVYGGNPYRYGYASEAGKYHQGFKSWESERRFE